jgi:hypothetical protein
MHCDAHMSHADLRHTFGCTCRSQCIENMFVYASYVKTLSYMQRALYILEKLHNIVSHRTDRPLFLDRYGCLVRRQCWRLSRTDAGHRRVTDLSLITAHSVSSLQSIAQVTADLYA